MAYGRIDPNQLRLRKLTIESNPTLSWIDANRREQQTVLDLVAALNEPTTLDELGVGPVRNAISDALFPGTSTVQTRARYFLFVPWILQMAGAAKPADRSRRERDLQLQLCRVLQKSEGRGEGVIGLRAGAGLRRWPSSIYWGGLMSWGIWRAPEFPEPAYGVMPNDFDGTVGGTDREADTDKTPAPQAWAPLPSPPSGFPEGVNFNLTIEEAKCLRARVEFSQPRSFVAHLLRKSDAEGIKSASVPWDCPSAGSAPKPVRILLSDARNLSFVHQGATILYNLMLAEQNGDSDRCDQFEKELDCWSGQLKSREKKLAAWDRCAMWARILEIRPNIRQATTAFVNAWCELAVGSDKPADCKQAKELVRDRELVLKGRRARLTYPDARERHRGYVATGQMTYRWGTARRILIDIVRALR